MGTDPVDIRGVIEEADREGLSFTGLPEGTTIGHMHLQVRNIPEAQAFYEGVLGFDLMAEMPSALFLSAGGYHHHLGMNIWHSRGASPVPEGSAGLRYFTVIMPSQPALDEVIVRLRRRSELWRCRKRHRGPRSISEPDLLPGRRHSNPLIKSPNSVAR